MNQELVTRLKLTKPYIVIHLKEGETEKLSEYAEYLPYDPSLTDTDKFLYRTVVIYRSKDDIKIYTEKIMNFTEKELRELLPYCKCKICSTPWWNIWKLYISGCPCRVCNGCVLSHLDFPSERTLKHIYELREIKRKTPQRTESEEAFHCK